MSERSKVLDDLGKVAGGAASVLDELRGQMRGRMQARMDRIAETVRLAPQSELDLVRDMASRARDVQEQFDDRLARLESRLEALERQIATGSDGKPPARRAAKATKTAKTGTARGRTTKSRAPSKPRKTD